MNIQPNSRPGSFEEPLRVAIVGAGPGGFYVLQHLLAEKDLEVRVDLFDKLPTPFGLVRLGVAPDHQKIKQVAKAYDRLAQSPGVRFFGNVEYGKDLRLSDLVERYHQVVFTTGAQSDKHLNIPGENLKGVHPATEFVSWYNGHPDYSHLQFDLTQDSAVVVGVGNVAVDVARLLCRDPSALRGTDVADYALQALRESRVRHVYLLGRRGPEQAAFTNHEIAELSELANTETTVRLDELEVQQLNRHFQNPAQERLAAQKLEILRGYAENPRPDRPRHLGIRFLVSPVEILGDSEGRVRGVRLVRNSLYLDGEKVRVRPTSEYEQLDCGLVFRSIGYCGVALPDLPFREDWCIIPSRAGRVLDSEEGPPLPGLYVAGWIKRGPTGVIGTNKIDAKETVASMVEDLREGPPNVLDDASPDAMPGLLKERGVRYVTYADWLELDTLELVRGMAFGRPRVKFTDREEFLAALEALEPPEE